ncbi:hypothetical protein ID866_10479 [Astraeus odoratus]|nr:hypothetical protein ID866_10479 [Astraeus odoratus]
MLFMLSSTLSINIDRIICFHTCSQSLAVNMRILEFLKGLFVQLMPNIMAWTNTLQVFLNE